MGDHRPEGRSPWSVGFGRGWLAIVVMMLVAGGCGGDDGDFDPETDPNVNVTTTTSAGTALERAEAESVAELASGQLTHDVPGVMEVGTTERITVTIGDQSDRDEFLDTLEAMDRLDDGEADNAVPVQVALQMRVSVTATPSFDVSAETSLTQTLGDDGVAEWRFQVTPSEPGEHFLVITAEAVVGEVAEAVIPPVYEGQVEVTVPERSFTDRVQDGAGPALAVLLALATVASGLAGAAALRDRRRATAAPANSIRPPPPTPTQPPPPPAPAPSPPDTSGSHEPSAAPDPPVAPPVVDADGA